MEKGQAQALVIIPPRLAPGDVVAVVAPASPSPREELLAGLAWLRSRYRLRVRPEVFARTGYLAGSDEARARDLAAAMTDPSVRAVVAARGGYGTTRIVERLPWDAWARAPNWIVGFSDVTALHAAAWARGVASIHGPNVTGLGRWPLPAVRKAWLDALEAPSSGRRLEGLRVVRGGSTPVVEGRLVGGNLALLEALAAQRLLTIPDGAVLALEEIAERPYRIDRMLTSLVLGGHLAGVRAVVLGDLTRCDAGPDGTTAEAVVRERLAPLGVPVLAGAPFGHEEENVALVLGAPVRVHVDEGRLVWCA